MANWSRGSWRDGSLAFTVSLVLQAVTAVGARATSVRRTAEAFRWEVSHDNLTISAPGCFFSSDGDYTNHVTEEEDCAATCIRDARCTHFDWSPPHRGRCQLKGGPIKLANAGSSDVEGAMCGVVLPGSRDRCQDSDSGWGGRALSLSGCFAGGAVAAAAVAGLIVWRARRKRSAAAAGNWGGEDGGAVAGAGATDPPPAVADEQGGNKSAAVAPQLTPAVPWPRAVAATMVTEGAAAASAAWPTARATVGGVEQVTMLGVQGRDAPAGGPGYFAPHAGVVTVWGPPHPTAPRIAEAPGREAGPRQRMLSPPPSPPSELWITEDIEEWRARHSDRPVTPPESRPSGW